jgi:hypothetical protein
MKTIVRKEAQKLLSLPIEAAAGVLARAITFSSPTDVFRLNEADTAANWFKQHDSPSHPVL